MKDAPLKSEQATNSGHERFLKSQTLEKIPRDIVVKRTADLEELVEATSNPSNHRMQTRGTKANVS